VAAAIQPAVAVAIQPAVAVAIQPAVAVAIQPAVAVAIQLVPGASALRRQALAQRPLLSRVPLWLRWTSCPDQIAAVVAQP